MSQYIKKQKLFFSPRQFFLDLILIIGGSIICAVAVNGILVPKEFAAGGLTGSSIILFRFFPGIGLGVIYFLINVPLFIVSWLAVGRRFFVYSLFGMVVLSLAMEYVTLEVPIADPMLGALLGGLLLGLGTGLSFRSSGSQGGLDLLSVIMLRRYSISLGTTIVTVNVFVLSVMLLFYSLEAVMYTLIVLVVASNVVDFIVTGLSKRKSVFIISRHWEQISQEILKDIRRGVTILKGQGGYNCEEENILYTVIPMTEIGNVKRLVASIDSEAFLVVSDTQEVKNPRIGNQPHW